MGRAIHNSTPLGILAAGFVSLIGFVLLVPNAQRLAGGGGSTPALVLAVLGVLLPASLIVIGYLLLRDETTATHLPRIAGWAALGTALLALILVLISLSGVELPLYAGATLLSVSTFAHVIIGVRDVQRIRAEELAIQREKLAVLNRLVRHNLRHEAQYLLGVESEIADAETPEAREELTERVRTIANRLSETHDTLKRSQEIIRSSDRSTTPVELRDAVEDVVREYRSAYPDATIAVDVPDEYRVSAGIEFRTVLEELIENAIVYADGEPDVRVSAAKSGRRIKLEVTDNGPGIPEPDRSVITREVEIDQMTHAQGLGLWFVRWAMDAYDGEFGLDTGDDGTTVTLELASS